jgi:tRNA threonylcarbamoyladenosine biosynthesis protein TsaB
MQNALQQAAWRTADVQLVAVTAGPGSFTGLRLGVTTAKTLAYAVGCDILGVNTLEVIASQAPRECSLIEVVLDAQRQQVFAGTLRRTPQGELAWHCPTHIVSLEQWLSEGATGAWLTGPLLEKIAGRLPLDARPVASRFWRPSAEAVGRLAWHHYRAGRRDDTFQLVPQYFRRSAAEEKWQAKNAAPPAG